MCPVISSNKTQLICQIAGNSGLIGGTLYPFDVQIKKTGYAIKRDIFTFTFMSSINSITPNTGIRLTLMLQYLKFTLLFYSIGSINGGTNVIITGNGFSPDSTTITLGTMKFTKNNAVIEYSKISLITNSASNLTVNLNVNVNGLDSICIVQSNCSYTFSLTSVPYISSVSPISVYGSTLVTIVGTQFGNDTIKLTVTLGDSYCNITTVNDTQILCLLNSLKVGYQNIIVNLKGLFKALF